MCLIAAQGCYFVNMYTHTERVKDQLTQIGSVWCVATGLDSSEREYHFRPSEQKPRPCHATGM